MNQQYLQRNCVWGRKNLSTSIESQIKFFFCIFSNRCFRDWSLGTAICCQIIFISLNKVTFGDAFGSWTFLWFGRWHSTVEISYSFFIFYQCSKTHQQVYCKILHVSILSFYRTVILFISSFILPFYPSNLFWAVPQESILLSFLSCSQ